MLNRLTPVVVRLLLLLLVPVLIVASTTTPADAATKRGPAVAFNWSWEGWSPGDYGDCTASANWVRVNDADPYIHVSGVSCDWGWNFDASTDGSDADYFTWHTGCDGPDGYLFNFSTHDWDHGSPDSFDLLPDPEFEVPDNCNVTGVSISYKDERWGNDSEYDADPTLALGVPPAPTEAPDPITSGSCPLYDFGKIRVWPLPSKPSWTGSSVNPTASGVALRITGLAKSGSFTGLYAYMYYQAPAGGGLRQINFGVTEPTVSSGTYNLLTGSMGEFWSRGSTQYADFTAGVTDVSVFVGVKPTYTPFVPPTVAPFNDPANCKFVFGVPRDASGISGPVSVGDSGGGVVEPDDPEPDPVNDPADDVSEEGCDGFSFTDPTSWAGAGICVLVKAVGRLIAVVGDVLGVLRGIVASILDGLGTLFLPPDNMLDESMETLSATVEDSNLDAWKDDATAGFNSATSSATGGGTAGAQGFAAGESCKGPPITWDKFEDLNVGGGTGTIYPFDACDGTGAELAVWCKRILTALIAVGGFLKIMQMLAMSIGLTKQVSALSHDWSGATIYKKGYGD